MLAGAIGSAFVLKRAGDGIDHAVRQKVDGGFAAELIEPVLRSPGQGLRSKPL
jgi:hypothetical protein